jgi:cytochrome P450
MAQAADHSPSSRPLPPHVPPELVFDFGDVLGPTTLDDPYAPAWEIYQKFPPVFFCPTQTATMERAGSWVCTRYEDIREVFQNTERYSSEGIFNFHLLIGESFKGLPIAVDPPEHDKYRILLNPWFSPKAVQALEHKIFATVN